MVPVAVGVSLNLESSTPEHSGLGPRIQELEIGSSGDYFAKGYQTGCKELSCSWLECRDSYLRSLCHQLHYGRRKQGQPIAAPVSSFNN
jgi:hypothetical protein